MELNTFIDELFGNIMTDEGIKSIKDIIKKDMLEVGKEYDSSKVEYQVFTENNNYTPRVEISSEGYDDGEVIFIDFHVDEVIK
ncbi:hypothetical protein [Clostridium sp. 1001283B150210_160208_E6]|uniref:hypothetical protein n=1 Tax=Clostridium sp. 1001283B150210_160208_E6 TaxID=2787129 RepID=UPI0018ABF65C|nr:hypothetical protein [Clostridium sp. 1001283B150210_160208_E6]